MREYEEYHELSALWGWVLMLLLCLSLIGWALFNYSRVKDRQRQWDYGAVPEAPAGSVFTTSQPAAGPTVQQQIEPLPNKQPLPPPPPAPQETP
jgi:uncharacterized iron-regulated membrane protein